MRSRRSRGARPGILFFTRARAASRACAAQIPLADRRARADFKIIGRSANQFRRALAQTSARQSRVLFTARAHARKISQNPVALFSEIRTTTQ
jgi:hypothetical protein